MNVVFFKIGVFRTKSFYLILISTLFIFLFYFGVHNIEDPILRLELSSLKYPGTVTIKDKKTLTDMTRELAGAAQSQVREREFQFKLLVVRKNSSRIFWLNDPSRLYDPRRGTTFLLKNNGNCLRNSIKQLELKNPYGKFLSWDEVIKVFRKYDKARVIDFETGLSFMVQRRAGSRHADVQPLTAEDSDIMKMIYGGRWSWKRRAVLVEVRGRRIAGSMNGMPHGAGAIGGNKFNGHFCIHFKDSTLHSGRDDLAHQMMIWKAAGVIDKMVTRAEPEQILRITLTALEQGDSRLALRFINTSSKSQEKEVIELIKSIKWVAVIKTQAIENLGGERYSVKLTYGLSDGRQYKNRLLKFDLSKIAGGTPSWKVNSSDILQLRGANDNGANNNDEAFKSVESDLEWLY